MAVILYGLLGPATVWRGGREPPLGSPQQRTLFALLLLHRNRTITTDRMADVVWPGPQPPNAVAVLRTYVSRLRAQALPGDVLLTRPGGYELRVAPGELDVDQLEALLVTARADLQRGAASVAEANLTSALALVRGPPLPELPDHPPAVAERARIDELCAAVREELVEARLAQGDHRELVPALRAAVTADPLRERVWGQLMVALYRSGRQADALAAYRSAHQALAELGLGPGPELQDLERRVLLQDASIAVPSVRVRRVPRYTTSLVGRTAELSTLEDHLRAARLVSVVGSAGAGKTRLAAEAARRAERRPGHRAWWVELGAVGPGRVVSATARALAVPQVPGRSGTDQISSRLGETPSLLVLDNCEHVIEEAAALAVRLLAGDAPVRVLTTSREPLRVGGERVVRLTGLPAGDAARLLSERAVVPPDDDSTVADLVARLDGLPLAIELAAVKLSSISLAELARGIRERLSLLGEGPRDAPARQRSLEAAIEWSYDLRSPAEQRLLRRLAVFPGSFDAAAATSVAGEDVRAELTRLVDASLLVADPPRYQLLMTVRTFARARLREAGEATTARTRHRDTYLDLAETVGRNMADAGLGPWLARGRLEHENFQAALHWSLDRGDADQTFRMAAWLALFWFRSGFVRDGRDLLERAMAGVRPGGPLWPRALLGRGMLACTLGSADALACVAAAVDAAREAGEDELQAIGLCWRGYARLMAGRRRAARADLLRGRSLAESVGSDEGMAFADQLLGDIARAEGDLRTAGRLLVRARDRYRRSRGTVDAGYTLIDLARVRIAEARFADALSVAADAVADFRSREDPRGLAGALQCLGEAYRGLAEPGRARAALEESRAIAQRWGGALWSSGQPDETRQEPPLRPGVEPLAEERAGTGVVVPAREQGDGDVAVGEELR